ATESDLPIAALRRSLTRRDRPASRITVRDRTGASLPGHSQDSTRARRMGHGERGTLMKHYSEADLLETYYMQPAEASPIIEHVNGCNECQERYRGLARKLRDIAACPAEKPATFWTRQRLMIMRAVDSARENSHRNVRTARVAAAAFLAFLLGG